MDNSKKLDFIHKMARLGLQHFDSGGSVQTQNNGLIGGASNLLGLTNNFQGQSADIQSPVRDQDAKNWLKAVGDQRAQMIDLGNALKAQNGIQNQSDVYNQVQGVVNGTGPNPALAQLNQATAANTANQAALMASQRGVGANTGLLARQAAQQGAANQQQAAGQAATLQANQSLNALNQAQGLATNQVNQQTNQTNAIQNANLGEQQTLLNAIAAQNNARVGMQSNINNVNAGIAAGNQNANTALFGAIGKAGGAAFLPAAAAEGGLVKLAEGGPIAMSALKNGQVDITPQSFVGNFLTASGPHIEQGPGMPKSNAQEVADDATDYISNLPKKAPIKGSAGELPGAGMATADSPTAGSMLTSGGAADALEAAPMLMAAAEGGEVPTEDKTVPAILSPGEVYLPPSKVKKVVQKGADPIKEGKKVPGKPKFKGNDYRNDTVPVKAEVGAIIIPNKVLQSEKPHLEAMKFVRAALAKKRQGLKK